jgi:hypothetical protein
MPARMSGETSPLRNDEALCQGRGHRLRQRASEECDIHGCGGLQSPKINDLTFEVDLI